jgi:hypothetical protein
VRLNLVVFSVLLATIVGLGFQEHGRAADADGMPLDIADLSAVFNDEIRAEHTNHFSGNVYAGLGNRLQLDGKAYNYTFQALMACDRIRATLAAPEFGGRQESLRRQSP